MPPPVLPISVAPLRWASDATLTMPGSKSEANRLLIAAALSGRPVRITGATATDDVRHLVRGLSTLGYLAHFVDETNGVVEVGPRRVDAATHGELFCGNAGTTLRFLISVAAITPGDWTLTGDAAMQRRPVGPLVAAWRQLGIDIEDHDGCPPVRVRGSDAVRGGVADLDASVSSQFVSSLLLVGACLPERMHVRCSTVVASLDYVTLTTRMLSRAGVATGSLRDTSFFVLSGYENVPRELAVGGDWSALGVWTCLGHLTGSRVVADNVAAGSGQADERLALALPTLVGDGDRTLDVGAFPDQFPNLAVVAAHRRGTTRFVGGANLRVKECDRIAVMARELDRLGVRCEPLPDGLVVHGGRTPRRVTIEPANDHRIAMAFALAGLIQPGVTIADADCVTKSYPTFWRDLATVQRSPRCVVVIGMRGAGKSTFARALAEALALPHRDTDRLFEERFRPITEFVDSHGWHNFRDLEAALIGEVVEAGHVVATGGGAVEHPTTQALLAEHALVVWLDADAATLRARIATDPRTRPSVTGAPVDQEIGELLARRRPLFEQLATFRIDATKTTAEQVAEARRLLGDTGA